MTGVTTVSERSATTTPPPPSGAFDTGRVVAAGCAVAAVAGLGAAVAGPVVLLALAGLALFALCAYRPIVATYLYVVTLPFVAGFSRGLVVPLVRPNEALLALLIAGAGAGVFARWAGGGSLGLRWRRGIDAPLIGFVLLCSVWSVTSLMLRGSAPTGGDLAAVLPILKLAGLFLLVRVTVVESEQLVRLVRMIIWPATGVAVIAVLQTLGVGPVLLALNALTPAEGGDTDGARGTTTLASSIATGDYIIIGLTLLIACGARGLLGRRERLGLGMVLGAGVLAAGQFSTWIAAVVAAVLILRRYPHLRSQALKFWPVGVLAVAVGAPAFIGRLAGFGDGFGMPRSWLGRWDNLSNFYLPPLFQEGGWLWGIGPDSVLAAPETWRETIYLESGYLQFLWIGGVPLLAGFAWLSIAILRRTRELTDRVDTLGACASALQIVWWMMIVLSIIDPHIFLRGTGDLLFVLLAITTGRLDDSRQL